MCLCLSVSIRYVRSYCNFMEMFPAGKGQKPTPAVVVTKISFLQ
jgi:hypothetical protein